MTPALFRTLVAVCLPPLVSCTGHLALREQGMTTIAQFGELMTCAEGKGKAEVCKGYAAGEAAAKSCAPSLPFDQSYTLVRSWCRLDLLDCVNGLGKTSVCASWETIDKAVEEQCAGKGGVDFRSSESVGTWCNGEFTKVLECVKKQDKAALCVDRYTVMEALVKPEKCSAQSPEDHTLVFDMVVLWCLDKLQDAVTFEHLKTE